MKAKRSLLAVVLTALLFPVGCGHIDKQETDAILVGVSGAALEASLIPVIGTPVATDGAVVQVGGLLISYVVDSLAEAPNNPDQVFDSVATVTAVRFTPVPITTGSPKLFFDINESLVLIGRLVDEGRLIDLSLRKFYGARNAGNIAKATLQRNAVCEAVVRFDANLRGLHDALINISTDIQGTAVASISITVAEALALREQIIRDGSFPPSEMFVFSEARVTPPEKAGAVREVELTTLSGLTNADLRGAVIFEKLASTIDRVSIQGFLPQDFTCNVIPPVGAPALSQWGAIIMSLLLLTAGLAFIVRRCQ